MWGTAIENSGLGQDYEFYFDSLDLDVSGGQSGGPWFTADWLNDAYHLIGIEAALWPLYEYPDFADLALSLLYGPIDPADYPLKMVINRAMKLDDRVNALLEAVGWLDEPLGTVQGPGLQAEGAQPPIPFPGVVGPGLVEGSGDRETALPGTGAVINRTSGNALLAELTNTGLVTGDQAGSPAWLGPQRSPLDQTGYLPEVGPVPSVPLDRAPFRERHTLLRTNQRIGAADARTEAQFVARRFTSGGGPRLPSPPTALYSAKPSGLAHYKDTVMGPPAAVLLAERNRRPR
jgi:hypothetical protein